jgi:ADP-heptose:LPS heptosyltransferase
VLIVRLDAIGDALTTLPLIAALRRHGYRVGAVLRPVNAQIFAARALDRVHLAGTPGLIEEIRREGYGTALIATEKPEAYRIARAAKIPVRIGFENGWGKPFKTLWVRRMCTHTIFRTAGLDPLAPHECAVVFKLAADLVPETEPPRDPAVLRELVLDSEPQPDSRAVLQITDKWERLGASLEHVRELFRRLKAHHGVRLIGAEREREYCERFAASANERVETFGDLARWKNAIAASPAVIAPDSGAVHVAGMTGTAVVACFASEHFALQTGRWAPWAAPNRVVEMRGDAWPMVAADALESLITGSPRAVYKG